ncbi:MAG TPA: T9SS type A sorting domain-containing protein [Flavobacteriales bacterium]|nr:T9SS type A sorting domain-containing protein [Flavobacteriales bacterium]
MFNKLITVIAVLITAISTAYSQPDWKFVGPKSNNNASGAEFETSQMTNVIADPNSTGHLFAISIYGGLWERKYNNGWKWTNIDMTPTGLRQSNAICIKNSTEIIVGNYCQSQVSNNGTNNFSTRVSSYNFVTQTWTNYPPITGITGKYTINAVEFNYGNSYVYVGTSVGLYMYNGTSWSLLVPNCVVRNVFFHDGICYMSGSAPAVVWSLGPPVVMASYNGTSFTSIPLGVSGNGTTEICPGPPGKIYSCTSAGPRYLHEITDNGSSFSVSQLLTWSGGGPDRMPIIYDGINNWIWIGDVKLDCYDLNYNTFYQAIKASFHSGGGFIHDDMHGFCISGNDLFVAHDGGIVRGSLVIPNLPIPYPINIYFDHDNDGLDVSLLWGFSGSEKLPNIYAYGQQDIVNFEIYDASIGMEKDVYNVQGVHGYNVWENHGAFMDKYDENFVLFDNSLYDEKKRVLSSGWAANPTPGWVNFYYPKATSPFSPDYQIYGDHEGQRTIQDPYRPKRIFEVGKVDQAGFSQFYYPSSFVLKAEFDTLNFEVEDWRQSVIDLSFSPESKNSLHVLVGGNWYPYPAQDYIWRARVFKYSGPNIDDCWLGHNMLNSGPPLNMQQWTDITPNYSNLSSMQIEGSTSFGVNMGCGDRALIVKIETSPWDKNVVYAAVDFGDAHTNGKFSVLRYTGTSWFDYSFGIPEDEIPYHMEMDYFSKDALYLVTDKSVYYRDARMGMWLPYSGGKFPQAATVQMEINYTENTLRAGTFGRGIWKTPLQCPTTIPINHTGTKSPDVYESSSITSSAIMTMTGGPTAYRGVNFVQLNPGFKAEATTTNNRYFYAFIHGCNGGGSSMRFSEEDSNWEEFEQEGEKENMLKTYPNPASNVIYVEFELEEGSKPELFLCDVSGKIIQKLGMMSFEGRTIIGVAGVENGVYFISVFENGNLIKSQKVVVSH